MNPVHEKEDSSDQAQKEWKVQVMYVGQSKDQISKGMEVQHRVDKNLLQVHLNANE